MKFRKNSPKFSKKKRKRKNYRGHRRYDFCIVLYSYNLMQRENNWNTQSETCKDKSYGTNR